MPAQPEVLLNHSVVDSDRDDSPEKCRARRRRRIELRRQSKPKFLQVGLDISLSDPAERPPGEVGQPQAMKQVDGEGTSNNVVARQPPAEIVAVPMPAFSAGTSEVNPMPVFGTRSIRGVAKSMEDAWFVKRNFCYPQIVSGQPVHFFAVYDGHGGSHVSSLCRRIMHDVIAEQLTRAYIGWGAQNGGGRSEAQKWEDLVRGCLVKSFQTVDKMASDWAVPGRMGPPCNCNPMELMSSGSTAVVALLTSKHIVVANCGDSRAVLCRGHTVIPLSVDHKPERPDELARINAAGGTVVYRDGLRVQGILNMSRSIGDPMLKSVVIAVPDVYFTERRPDEDECLILASDGLWDVIPDELACRVAKTCLREEGMGSSSCSNVPINDTPECSNMQQDENEALLPSTSSLAAATLLSRLALARRSRDNITVVVVDLKSKA